MSLNVHRSERADALLTGLAQVLKAAPEDPFAPDVIAVPSKGVERWLSQSLSSVLGASSGRDDGVCANVVFPSPGRLVLDAVTAGSELATDEDPWAQERLPWPLLEVIDGCGTEAWCLTLGRHLGAVEGSFDQGRRMAVAQKLAGLYSSYAAQRPAMVLDWVLGHDTDGSEVALDPDHMWQAELWRRLRHHLGVESPAERMEAACARLREDPDLVDLPERFSVFGPTRLTMDQLQVLDALAEHRDIHLWLPHPSGGMWERLAHHRPDQPHLTTRRADPTAELPTHPLVRSLARDARELQVRMYAHLTPTSDEHHAAPLGADSLLQALQRDIHTDHLPSAAHLFDDADTSVRVHACHGRQRQVEVLREVLLGMLADDPTLELRDIIVMCPDIESYAPLISAAFGLSADDLNGDFADAHPGHRLTVRLADRSLRQTNPVLAVVARLLELADARITVSEVLDLAAMPPVRRRFRFDDDGLERIGDWVRSAGVRWGLDAQARAPFGLINVAQNTWRAGLDRVLLGVVMDEDDSRTLGDALPLDGVDSTDIDLAGRLAQLVDRLDATVEALHGSKSLQAWVTALTEAVDGFVEVTPDDAWQFSQARRQLSDALASADLVDASGATLDLADVRALLGDQLRGRPTRANFRTGHLTMCTMVPMRSVPHRVVCLLGLDDGVFPRGARIDGDDILTRRPRVGERDVRSEDRQLFLDAILAARERLVVLYSGAHERTGAVLPPAVPLGELLDVLDQTADVPDGRVRDRILTRHPLQPFDGRNFVKGELGQSGEPFSFDIAAYAGSRAVRSNRAPRPPFLTKPLAETESTDLVTLDALVRFLEQPVKQFMRQRLGLSTTDEGDEPLEALPVDLDALEKWSVGDRLLNAGLAGVPPDRAVRAEVLRGLLPPGSLGGAVVDPILDEVKGLVDHSAAQRTGQPEHIDISIPLSSGATLVGTVASVYGDRLVRVVYSRLGAKHRLRAWAQLLALCAQSADRPWEAVVLGRGRGGVRMSQLARVTRADAVSNLDDLVATYRAGLNIPLPLPPKSAAVYAAKRRDDISVKVAEKLAGKEWRNGSGPNQTGEFSDPDFQRVWGDAVFELLLKTPPDPSNTAWPEEPHLFGQLARAVWTPLLDAETVVHL